MKKFISGISPCVVIIIFALTATFAQTAKNASQSAANKQSVEVIKFGVKEGVEFPAITIDVMMSEIVDELLKIKKFSQIKLNNPPAAETKAEKPEGEAEKELPAAEEKKRG